ncbi:unnamed protein product [Spodoptera littoralis]|uniref:Uncharacterized protein n=1 Tax=Spodoptera littoralis TaxID=7109 RepID=A0A9P0I0D4_SPOLI|nr:unnamed protein product [Spodoptera littoralis]CAH1637855.1 unnamed protein product [Spodoptera littoralis]
MCPISKINLAMHCMYAILSCRSAYFTTLVWQWRTALCVCLSVIPWSFVYATKRRFTQ